jgi:HD-GYP domain-containing protein (c-di-GMP phosphodiesterase class II)
LRDHETEGHSRRVTEMAERLGRKMGMNEDELRQLHRGGLLHDIGKIAIPDAVLLKRDKLTPKEVELIRHHPQFAKSFMEQIEFLKPAMAVPYSHHEKWDGSGYPEGLKGEKIPMLARIFAVADVWDALTSERPYRRPISFSEALDYIRSESGKHFDPKVVEAFTQVLGEMLKEQQRPQKK